MRSGSPAQDGEGWPSSQRPYPDEATSGPVRYGSGPRSDPHEGHGGRRDVPFGPEISWPYGFRQLDPESRQILESAYGTGPAHQQPPVDDFGYGDPGYSDPSYEGTPYGGHVSPGPSGGHRGAAAPRAFGGSGYRQPEPDVPGYHVPEVRDSGRSGYASPGYQPQDYAPPSGGQDIWPVTGAQEALPDTGPQPAASAWNTGSPGSGSGPTGNTAYPDRWYDHPRLDDRVADDVRPSRSADPRLEGMTYGELRYDDADPVTPRSYDEPLDDESWYQELRRSAPAYPQRSGGPQGSGGPPASGGPQGSGGPPASGGSQPRVQPQGPGSGRPSGYPQAPDRSAGYGNPRGDWGGSAPQMSAGRMTSSGPRSGGAFPADPAPRGTGFFGAPVGQVSVLTPPSGTRVDALRDPDAFPAAPAAPRPGVGPVRPGHGLDGPEITSSWPVQPTVDDLDSYEDFWRDDADEEYTGLFGNREAEFERADARQAAAKRRIGRRRGGSNDRRLWLGLGGVVIVAAAAITGILKFEFPSHGGPAHIMAAPSRIGTYVRTVDLERSADLAHLRAEVIQMSSGQASHVVSAIYESGNSAAGNTTEIIMFIGGHLANADPAASINGFIQKFPGAHVVSAGTPGGKAACAEEGTKANSVAICAFFDNDSFGEITSPTMKADALAGAMRTIRPSVETLSPK